MEIPDTLLCLFTARPERRDGTYVLEVPADEFRTGDLREDETYRVAMLAAGESPGRQARREPPVAQGDTRFVEIEGIGDQGDGIARVDRGYVVIVPGTDVGDRVEVEIESLHPNFAMARVVDVADPE